MKKILFAIAIVLMVSFTASAQRDSFFNDWEDVDNRVNVSCIDLPTLPGSHGWDDDINAPLGSGLLVLTALGAGYAVAHRKREE